MDEPARATTPRHGLDLWSADRRQANRVKIIFDVQLIELSKTGARYTVKIFLSLSLRPNYFHCCYAPLYFCTLSAARSNLLAETRTNRWKFHFFFLAGQKNINRVPVRLFESAFPNPSDNARAAKQ